MSLHEHFVLDIECCSSSNKYYYWLYNMQLCCMMCIWKTVEIIPDFTFTFRQSFEPLISWMHRNLTPTSRRNSRLPLGKLNNTVSKPPKNCWIFDCAGFEFWLQRSWMMAASTTPIMNLWRLHFKRTFFYPAIFYISQIILCMQLPINNHNAITVERVRKRFLCTDTHISRVFFFGFTYLLIIAFV